MGSGYSLEGNPATGKQPSGYRKQRPKQDSAKGPSTDEQIATLHFSRDIGPGPANPELKWELFGGLASLAALP
jgi:hypothetical protein